jgi:hypothetical protein
MEPPSTVGPVPEDVFSPSESKDIVSRITTATIENKMGIQTVYAGDHTLFKLLFGLHFRAR